MTFPSVAEQDLVAQCRQAVITAFPSLKCSVLLTRTRVTISWENGPSRRRLQQEILPLFQTLPRGGRTLRMQRVYTVAFRQRVDREVLRALGWRFSADLTLPALQRFRRMTKVALEDRTVIARIASGAHSLARMTRQETAG